MFVRTKRVSWGDCDPAGILYTPRVFDYCTEALEEFYGEVLGTPWIEMIGRNLGSPMVHVECDYLKPMRPGTDLAVSVRIEKLGGSSLTYGIDGRDPSGDICFRARYVACITDFGAGRAVPIPPALRARAEAYMAACGA